MDIRYKATNIELNSTISDYAENRIAAISHHLGEPGDSVRCEVELGRSAGHSKRGDVWFAEINLFAADGKHFYARQEAESINAAIDTVKDEILNQLRKMKKVERGVLRKSGALLKKLLRRA